MLFSTREGDTAPELFDQTIVCPSGSFTEAEGNSILICVCQSRAPELSFSVSYSVRCYLTPKGRAALLLSESQIGKYRRQAWRRRESLTTKNCGLHVLRSPCQKTNWNYNFCSLNWKRGPWKNCAELRDAQVFYTILTILQMVSGTNSVECQNLCKQESA